MRAIFHAIENHIAKSVQPLKIILPEDRIFIQGTESKGQARSAPRALTCHVLPCLVIARWHASCAATCARALACALERPLTIQPLSLRPRANRRASASPQMARGCFCHKPDARKTPSRARHRRCLRRPTRRAASKPRCRALQLLASTTTPPRTAATGTPRARTERGGRLNARGPRDFLCPGAHAALASPAGLERIPDPSACRTGALVFENDMAGALSSRGLFKARINALLPEKEGTARG